MILGKCPSLRKEFQKRFELSDQIAAKEGFA
jgi:hypothetical protein